MIYIFSALYREAAPLIRHFRLKRTEAVRGTESFTDGERFLLTLTGSGLLNAASTASAVLSRAEVTEEDRLVCWGSAASLEGKTGGLYIVNKLTERYSGRSYYPDMIIDTGLPEASLLSGNELYSQGDVLPEGYNLYDMESAAVFHAGKMFFPPHRMFFLRFVSDSGCPSKMTGSLLEEYAGWHLPAVSRFLEMLAESGEESVPVFTEDDLKFIERTASQLKCTAYMKNELYDFMRYAKLAGIGFEETVSRLPLPAESKEEGKEMLNEIRRFIIQ